MTDQKIDLLTDNVGELKAMVRDVLDAISSLSTHVDERFATKDDLERFATKDDLERFATKDDLEGLEGSLRSEMGQMKDDVITEIDRFVVLHQTLDVELVSLRSRQDRQDVFLQQVAKRLDLEYVRH